MRKPREFDNLSFYLRDGYADPPIIPDSRAAKPDHNALAVIKEALWSAQLMEI